MGPGGLLRHWLTLRATRTGRREGGPAGRAEPRADGATATRLLCRPQLLMKARRSAFSTSALTVSMPCENLG